MLRLKMKRRSLLRKSSHRELFLQSLENRIVPATLIPASSAFRTDLPAVPGDGVHVDIFNGIGGWTGPTHKQLARLTHLLHSN